MWVLPIDAPDEATVQIIDDGEVGFATQSGDAVRIERMPAVQIIDDGDQDFVSIGGARGWVAHTGEGGYDDDYQYSAKGAGANVASWTFDVQPGWYRVSTTWVPHRNRATDAPFSIWDGGSQIAQLSVDQELAPGDFIDDGSGWHNLGTIHYLSGHSLVVRLTNAADDHAIADAVRIERVSPVQIADDSSEGFATAGTGAGGWVLHTGGGGHDGTYRYSAAGTGANTAAWTFAVEPGWYRVSTTWVPHRNRATDAPFSLWDGDTQVAELRVNQEATPGDFVDAGSWWHNLGTLHYISGGSLVVKLTNAANQYVIADAVRIEQVPAVQIQDDSSARFAAAGSSRGGWVLHTGGGGHGDSYLYSAAGTGRNVATWTFDIDPGWYRVSTTWVPHRNRATDAPFSIWDGGNLLETVKVNQELAPGDFADNGSDWHDLSTLQFISGNSLVITLSNDADDHVIADAVRIDRMPEP